ncbi:MAG: MarR family transcriptional regulator [Anaerocolumna sp.]
MYKIEKLISITSRKSQIFYAPQLADLNISSGQFMYIVAICENEGAKQDELGEIVGINKSTTAKMVTQLVTEGYARREQDSKDKRVYHVYPTEKTKKVYPKVIRILDQWSENLMNGLTKEECESLMCLMTIIEQNARKYSK